jgi:hypothetical protein
MSIAYEKVKKRIHGVHGGIHFACADAFTFLLLEKRYRVIVVNEEISTKDI